VRWYDYDRRNVSVGERRAIAARELASLREAGRDVQPVHVIARTIAHTFWGKAWCRNLQRYADYSSRLARGRSYVRTGSILDLQISVGRIVALVSGSELYEVDIQIQPLDPAHWDAVRQECAGQIASLVELLEGRLRRGVMEVVTRADTGLFPTPAEIDLHCTCPDWAQMCKHVAAVLYGVGHRLDKEPETLFLLRGVQPIALVEGAFEQVGAPGRGGAGQVLDVEDLSSVFGVDIDFGEDAIVPAGHRAVGDLADDAIEPAQPYAAHASESWQRAANGQASAVVLHESSDFPFGNPETGERAHVHVALAVGEGRRSVVHGVVDHRSFVCEDGVWFEAVEDQEFEELFVGSERWFELASSVRESAPQDLGLIHVMGPRAEGYGLFARLLEQGDEFVIRAKRNRRLVGETGALFDPIASAARSVGRLSMRARRVTLRRPPAVAPLGDATMALSVVEVSELDTAGGDVSAPMRLLSSLPIDTSADIRRIVNLYRKRTLLEEFLAALRASGVSEKDASRGLWSLLDAISLSIPATWRGLAHRGPARSARSAPNPR